MMVCGLDRSFYAAFFLILFLFFVSVVGAPIVSVSPMAHDRNAERRKEEAARMLAKYENRIPVIVVRHTRRCERDECVFWAPGRGAFDRWNEALRDCPESFFLCLKM
jgi:hypothetical protein